METREEAIEKTIRQIRRLGEEQSSFSYHLELRDKFGNMLDTVMGSTKDYKGDENAVEKVLDSMEVKLRSSMKDNPSTYALIGYVGAANSKKKVQINNPIPVENDDDEYEQMIISQPAFVRQPVQQQPKQETVKQEEPHKDSLSEVFETLNVMGEAFGVKGLGNIDSLENKKLAFVMQMRENQLKAEATEKAHLGTIETQEKEITELKAQMKVLKEELEKLRSENDKHKKYIERVKPDLRDYSKLKNKNAQIASVLGQSLGHVLSGVISHTKYGALLGITEDIQQPEEDEYGYLDEEGQRPQPQQVQQVQQEQPQQAIVEQVD